MLENQQKVLAFRPCRSKVGIMKMDEKQFSWSSSPTRQYRIYGATSLGLPPTWTEVGLGLISPAAGSSTSRNVPPSANPYRFFLIEAIQPLSP